MYLGRVVAQSSHRSFWSAPLHPYVMALRDATPTMDVLDADRPVTLLEGEVPSALDPPSGCRFSTRCPYVVDVCRSVYPPLRAVSDVEAVACHRVEITPEGDERPGASMWWRTGGPHVASAPSPLWSERVVMIYHHTHGAAIAFNRAGISSASARRMVATRRRCPSLPGAVHGP